MRTPRKALMIALGLAVLVGAGPGDAVSQGVTFERLLNADKDAGNWLTYFRDYRGWRYSPLKQVNTTKVKRLVHKCVLNSAGAGMQLSPTVVTVVMFITNS